MFIQQIKSWLTLKLKIRQDSLVANYRGVARYPARFMEEKRF